MASFLYLYSASKLCSCFLDLFKSINKCQLETIPQKSV